ncbi:MAG TPA: ABC transporter substrate-binding protein [Thermopetrobacter sp.]|nr:ABC transporter substrate-binding protein [Thermopetrobacter sp.]
MIRTQAALMVSAANGAPATESKRTMRIHTGLAVIAAWFALVPPPAATTPAAAAEARAAVNLHPSVRYMQNVARDLLRAQRVGTRRAFIGVISRHADVPSIASYALGRYRGKLRPGRKATYYRAVVRFMARYFATEAPKYPVARSFIEKQPRRDGANWLVRSRVDLKTGGSYEIIWTLAPRRGGYRIVDVKVMGFSLSVMQRGIFYEYLQKKNGDVEALIAALYRAG